MVDVICDTKAQVPQCCHMCEEKTEIKYKCLDCNFLLCERCRKFHEKVKTQEVHKIISIKDEKVIGDNTLSRTRVTAIRCTLHKDQNYIMYCQECRQPVCTMCVFTVHQKHAMGDLKAIVSDKVAVLQDYLVELEEIVLPDLTLKKDKLNDLLKYHAQKADKTKSRINEWGQYLKDAVKNGVDQQSQEFFQEIDKNMKKINEKILPQISEVNDMKSKVDEIRKRINDTTENVELTEAIDLERMTASIISKVKMHRLKARTHFFLLEETPLNTVSLLGSLKSEAVFVLQLVESIDTGMPTVDKIVSGRSGTLYLKNWDSGMIRKIKIEKSKVVELDKWKADVKGMALLGSGDILLFFSDKSQILLLPGNDKIENKTEENRLETAKIFFDSTPHVPTALHVTRENTVVVSTMDSGGDMFPSGDLRKIRIVLLAANSERLSTFDYNKDLFCFPDKIITVADCICVADSISEYSGRLVTLDCSGKVKWIYGDDSNSVVVGDMVSTVMSHVILFEACKRVLIVLDSDGKCLRQLSVLNFGISHPFSMNITKDEKLLIGCGHAGKNLHVLKMME